jgi:hypothetical protein
MGSTGHQTWHVPSGGIPSVFGDARQAISDANRDMISGVAMCSDYSGATVFVANPIPSVLEQLSAVGSKFPGFQLDVKNVAAGLTAQLAASDRVTAMEDSTSTLSGVSADMYSGGLEVRVQPSAWPASDALKSRINSAATANGAIRMPVTLTTGPGLHNFTTRLADTQPYYGGDEIRGATGICSAGVPILVNGVHAMLTAGHCTDSSFTNNGHAFGSQYTTAYPGNADIYGDWKLLSGESYGLRIFSGAVSSSSTLPVSGANWGARNNGLQMCTSGATTGSICRYFIFRSFAKELIEGVWTNNLLEMTHDSTGTNLYEDLDGADHGDSGGPCYYSDGAGGVIDAGIVQGGGDYVYTCAQLSGVRAWKSGASLG